MKTNQIFLAATGTVTAIGLAGMAGGYAAIFAIGIFGLIGWTASRFD